MQLGDSLLVDFEISERCLVCVTLCECTSGEIVVVRRSKQENAFTAMIRTPVLSSCSSCGISWLTP